MGLEPKIPKPQFKTKKCSKCGNILSTEDFTKTHSIFYPDGLLPICDGCANDYLKEHNFEWEAIDKLCQWADIPFIVKEAANFSNREGLWEYLSIYQFLIPSRRKNGLPFIWRHFVW